MKKTLLSIATIAIMATSFQVNAAVGLAAGGIFGGLAAAYGGIFGGLAAAYGGFMAIEEIIIGPLTNQGFSFARFYLGILILDGENGQEIQFKQLPEEELLKMNLTLNEARAYNANTEELSQAFKVVSSELDENSKIEDAKKLWEEQVTVLGLDTINGAKKVLAGHLNK